MTKDEFTQEAALRLITAKPELLMGDIADMAKILAEELFHEEERLDVHVAAEETTELKCANIGLVATEIARVEKEMVDKKNADARAKGLRGWHRADYYQRNGADVRFSNVCRNYDIKTVSDLIGYGRVNFRRCKNMGEQTLNLVDKALQNLYDIKSW